MAKILVTGGAGFIGSHVADAYLEAGHEVVCLDNLLSGVRGNVPANARFIEMDIRSESLGALFDAERFDFVNHLAAQIDVRRSVAEPRFDADINILGGINILENCVKYKVKKILFSSTGGAIYGQPKNLPASEETCPEPECHYATSKLSFEFYMHLYARLYGLHFTILRFPNIYGPRQRPDGEAGVCSILAGMMLQGKQPTLFGFGEPLRDYVFVGDIARATVLALERGDNTIINLGSGKGTSVRELFDLIGEFTGYSGEPNLAPLRPGEVERVYITGDRAREILAWTPATTLREGLRQTVEHIRKEMETAS